MANSHQAYLRSLEEEYEKPLLVRNLMPKPSAGLTVTVSLAGGQAGAVNAGPINFTVMFNQPATGFTNADVSFTGSTAGGTLAAAVTGSGSAYNVAVTGMTTNGNVVISIPAASATDAMGKPFPASNSATVIFDTSAPLQVTGLTATVVGAAPADASIAFQSLVTSGTGGSSYTLSFTAASAAGQERLVAISGISNSNTTTITFSSVTIDGQSATAVGSHVRATDGGANGPVIAFFRAPGTAATTFNVAYTCSNAMFDGRCFLWNLSGAGTLLATASAFENANVVADQNLSLNTAAGGAVAAAMLAYSDISPKTETWTGLTERSDSMGFYGNDWQSCADLNVSSASTPLTVTAHPSLTHFGGAAQVGMSVSFNHA